MGSITKHEITTFGLILVVCQVRCTSRESTFPVSPLCQVKQDDLDMQ